MNTKMNTITKYCTETQYLPMVDGHLQMQPLRTPMEELVQRVLEAMTQSERDKLQKECGGQELTAANIFASMRADIDAAKEKRGMERARIDTADMTWDGPRVTR